MKRQLTSRIDGDLLDELRAATLALQRDDPTATLAGVVEQALTIGLEQLRATYNAGEPFEQRPAPLRPGPRIIPAE